MTKILFINACVRENSRTLALANHVLNELSGEIEEVNLYKTELLPLDNKCIEKRDSASASHDYSDEIFNLAKQFASADIIVVAAPYWDLMFPAVVKSYFELVTVSGLTFVYGDNGIPNGLCNAKRLIYITTSGGPIIQNFGYDYITALAKSFYGISDVRCISAQGLDIHGADANAILLEAEKSVIDLL